MSPDPPIDPVDGCLSCTYDVGAALQSSDESDNDTEQHVDAAYDGYTLLGQNEFGGNGPLDNEDAAEMGEINRNEDGIPQVCQETNQNDQPAPSPAGRAELIALWNTPATTASGDIMIDDERSEQIRAAMAGFSLPASSVPAWAANIPEEQWKQRLLDRLQQSGHRNVSHSSTSLESKPPVFV